MSASQVQKKISPIKEIGLLPRILVLKVLSQLWLHKKLDFNSIAEFDSLTLETKAYIHQLYTKLLRQCGQIDFLILKAVGPAFQSKNFYVMDVLRVLVAEFIFMKLPGVRTLELAEELLQSERFKSYLPVARKIIKHITQHFTETSLSEASFILNLPEWLFKKWHARFGLGVTQQILLTFMHEPQTDVLFQGNSDLVMPQIKGKKLPYDVVRCSSSALLQNADCYKNGLCWEMDWSAALVALFTGVKSGEKLLDLCAGAGGKAMSFVRIGADVTLVEKDPVVFQELQNNFARTNLKAEVMLQLDALEWQSDVLYDVVLVDPPSSETGNLRHNPQNKYLLSEEGIVANRLIQQNLLRVAYDSLKPGGVLVYTTNSLENEENVAQIEVFLRTHSDCSRVEFSRDELGFLGNFLTDAKDLLVLPFALPEPSGCDGIFMSRIRKAKTLETEIGF